MTLPQSRGSLIKDLYFIGNDFLGNTFWSFWIIWVPKLFEDVYEI